jgi:hypothetical protein
MLATLAMLTRFAGRRSSIAAVTALAVASAGLTSVAAAQEKSGKAVRSRSQWLDSRRARDR